MQEMQVWSLGQEDSLEKEMATHSSVVPGRFHGHRSRAGYNPWDCKTPVQDLVPKQQPQWTSCSRKAVSWAAETTNKASVTLQIMVV